MHIDSNQIYQPEYYDNQNCKKKHLLIRFPIGKASNGLAPIPAVGTGFGMPRGITSIQYRSGSSANMFHVTYSITN